MGSSYRINAFLLIFFLLIFVVYPTNIIGQENKINKVDCNEIAILHAPQYEIALHYFGARDTDLFFVYISIDPKYFKSRRAMIALARQLNNDFCQYNKLFIEIFSDFNAASKYVGDPDAFPHYITRGLLRGHYDLDRANNKETLRFFPGKDFSDESKSIEIELGSSEEK